MRNKFDKNHILKLCNNNCYTAPSMDGQTALNELCRYFLGTNWYDCSGLVNSEQVNVNIVCEIEKRYKGAKLKPKVTYE